MIRTKPRSAVNVLKKRHSKKKPNFQVDHEQTGLNQETKKCLNETREKEIRYGPIIV